MEQITVSARDVRLAPEDERAALAIEYADRPRELFEDSRSRHLRAAE
jgi:hypothetical protein